MNRNLKALGLALAAVVAMSAMAPLPAHAQLQGALTSDGPVTLVATETGESSNGFLAFGDSIRCPGSIYTGHKYNSTPHELIPSGSTTITITPHYSFEKCRTTNANLPVTIFMNGCDFVLHIGTTTGKAGQHLYAATTDVVCPAEKTIQLTVFTSSAHSTKSCTWTIGTQNGLTGIRIRHTTSPADTIDLLGTLQGMHVERSGTCAEGASTTTSEGKIQIDAAGQGKNAAADNTALTVTDSSELPVEPETIFTADGPVTLTGTETGEPSANGLTAFGDTIRCAGSTFTGHQVGSTTKPVLSGATATTITPHYKQEKSNCRTTINNFPVTIEMNGCDYVMHLGETAGEDKYSVSTDIVCPEGKDIQMTEFLGTEHVAKVCTLTVKAQTGRTGAYAKVTTASGDLHFEGTVEGIHVERSGLCAEEGETTTKVAKIDLALTIQGADKTGKATSVSLSDEGLPQALTSDGPVTLMATETGEASANGFTIYGEAIRCPGSIYTGHAVGMPTGPIQSGATEITVTPHYKQTESNCRTSIFKFPATVHTSGCDYVLHLSSETSEHTYGVTTDIVCPDGNEMQLTVLNMAHSTKICTLKIKPQTGLTGLYLKTTTEPGDLDLEGTLEGIHVERVGCGGTTSEGKIDFDLTVEGLREDGEDTPVSVTSTA